MIDYGGKLTMANKNHNNKNQTLESMKSEIASEHGVDLKSENLTARDAGRVGGTMTKELVEAGKKRK